MCQLTTQGKKRILSTVRASSLYEVLGVARDAGAGEIQRAYRRLVRRCHPDVSSDPAAAERFQEIVEAYEVLSDPQRRAGYDAAAGTPGRTAGARRRPTGDFRTWRPQDKAGRSWSGSFRRTGLRADPDLAGGGAGGAARHGQDIEVPLTVAEAYVGVRRAVTLNLPGGRRTVAVDIPPGMVDGQRLKLSGLAGISPGARLRLVVRLAPDPLYQVRRRDVTVDLPLSPWEAALGATVAVVTPAGGRAGLRVPPGTSSGQVLRVKGLGIPHAGGEPGDLFAVARIVVPASLGNDERQLLERLAAASTFDPRSGARA